MYRIDQRHQPDFYGYSCVPLISFYTCNFSISYNFSNITQVVEKYGDRKEKK
jgi:hypothetical protein